MRYAADRPAASDTAITLGGHPTGPGGLPLGRPPHLQSPQPEDGKRVANVPPRTPLTHSVGAGNALASAENRARALRPTGRCAAPARHLCAAVPGTGPGFSTTPGWGRLRHSTWIRTWTITHGSTTLAPDRYTDANCSWRPMRPPRSHGEGPRPGARVETASEAEGRHFVGTCKHAPGAGQVLLTAP